jgi:hypothetical protein
MANCNAIKAVTSTQTAGNGVKKQGSNRQEERLSVSGKLVPTLTPEEAAWEEMLKSRSKGRWLEEV